MSNFFAGIHRANDALTAARFGLQVTGQNIANAGTPGYTRQAAGQSAIGSAVGVPTLHAGRINEGGVRSTGAYRLNDPILDIRARAEHARSANVDINASRLADIENIFTEPSDTGLAEQFHDFWNSWGDVADDPGNQVPRQMLVSSAQSTATKLHAMDASLDSVANAAKESLGDHIADVNSAAKELADLNRKIAIGNPMDADGNIVKDPSGANINTLLDRRDVLLDKISTAVGGEVTIHNNGTASVTVAGKDLVSVGTDANGNVGRPPFKAGSLDVAYATTDPATGAVVTMTPAGGAANGNDDVTLIDPDTANDGASPVNKLTDSAINAEVHSVNDVVPGYRKQLDTVAQKLADTVNDIQTGGYDLNGDAGQAMLDDGAGNTTGVTAKNITVVDDFTAPDGYELVAAASEQTAGGNVGGENALNAANAAENANGPDKAYSSLIGELGRASASAQQQQATQAVITNSVDTMQQTSSGVSFDEEVSNMLTYQKAFQASSRVLTAIDDMLDTLINRTGRVGR